MTIIRPVDQAPDPRRLPVHFRTEAAYLQAFGGFIDDAGFLWVRRTPAAAPGPVKPSR